MKDDLIYQEIIVTHRVRKCDKIGGRWVYNPPLSGEPKTTSLCCNWSLWRWMVLDLQLKCLAKLLRERF